MFSVLDLATGRLVDHAAAGDMLAAVGLHPVPQLGTLVLDHSVDQLVAFAEGVSVLNPGVQREGVVLRPPAEDYDPDVGGRLSFEVINPNFRLKFDE